MDLIYILSVNPIKIFTNLIDQTNKCQKKIHRKSDTRSKLWKGFFRLNNFDKSHRTHHIHSSDKTPYFAKTHIFEYNGIYFHIEYAIKYNGFTFWNLMLCGSPKIKFHVKVDFIAVLKIWVLAILGLSELHDLYNVKCPVQ